VETHEVVGEIMAAIAANWPNLVPPSDIARLREAHSLSWEQMKEAINCATALYMGPMQ